MWLWLNFGVKRAFSLALWQHSAEVVFINLHWKDAYGHSGKAVEFCRHKSSSLYNQAVEAKKQGMTPDVGTYYWSELLRPVRRHLIESIFWRLPRPYDVKLDHDDP